MPASLRALALFHTGVLVLLVVVAAAPPALPAFGLVAILFLTPLGPLLFLDRPLMWHLAKSAAYLFGFATGLWVIYAVLDIGSLGDVARAVLLALLAFYLIGVGGYLKTPVVRAHFASASTQAPAAR
jgi:hypothetical protein